MFKFSSNTLDQGYVKATQVDAIKPITPIFPKTGKFSVSALATSENKPKKISELRNAIGSYETKNVPDPYKFSQPAPVKNNPNNVALGRYQVTTDELSTYGPRYLGRIPTAQEFLNSPALQDEYMDKKLEDQRKQGADDDNLIANHRGGITAKVEDRQGYINAVKKELPKGFQFSSPTLEPTSQASVGFEKTKDKAFIPSVKGGLKETFNQAIDILKTSPFLSQGQKRDLPKSEIAQEEEGGSKVVKTVLSPGTELVANPLKKRGVNPYLAGFAGLAVDVAAPGPGEFLTAGKEAKAVENLAQEAKKYKTSEEFIQALQGTNKNKLLYEWDKVVTGKEYPGRGWFDIARDFYKEVNPADALTQQAEVKRVANNLSKNNPGLQQKEAEAIARDVIEGRKFNQVSNPLTQEARKYKSAEEFVNAKAPLPGLVDESTLRENLVKAKDNLEIYKQRGDTSGIKGETNYINSRQAVLDKRSQLTDIYNQANELPSARTSEIPAREQTQYQSATENLSRAVEGQAQTPTQSKVFSSVDNITKPLESKVEAVDSFRKSDLKVKAPKNPQLVDGADKFKDISGFKGQARDMYRNFKAFFGESFPKVKKAILDPFDAAKGRYVNEQKNLLSELRTKVVDNGIRKGSKESAAVMDYGEKLITKEDLVKKFGQEKANKIIEADAWFRKTYDRLLEEVNVVRAKIYPKDPTKIIPKRKDYYRHFQELGGLEGLKNIFENPAGISPALSGVSPFTKPRSKFLSFAQRRLGLESARDAVGGFLEYVPSFAYAKHIDPQIGNFRNLASDLALKTEESRNANNFIEFLQDFANDLSGKTNAADRFVQKVIPGGRKTFAAINWLNSRVKANTILGNASSAVAQIFNVPQGIASAKLNSVPGALRTIGSIFAKNAPMEDSVFINERYIGSLFQSFDEKMLSQPKKFAVWMTGALDELGTKFIWNSHYEKALRNKVADPVKYADDTTRALVAGRGVGEVPLLQKSKLFQIFAPFQLEVGNLWYVMGDQIKNKDFSGLATLFLANYLFNRVAEQVRGSDVVFDPINAVYEGVQSLQQEKDKKLGAEKLIGRVVGEGLSNIPFGQTLASMYPEYGVGALGGLTRAELFGEGDPTRFGGGLITTKALQDPLFKVLPPFGGSQIKKTGQGLNAFSDGKVVDKKGKTQYKVEDSTTNLFRAALFGKYSFPEAREYYDSLQKPKGSTGGKFKFNSSGL